LVKFSLSEGLSYNTVKPCNCSNVPNNGMLPGAQFSIRANWQWTSLSNNIVLQCCLATMTFRVTALSYLQCFDTVAVLIILLLFGWQEGHLACKNLHRLSPMAHRQPTNQSLHEKWPIKQCALTHSQIQIKKSRQKAIHCSTFCKWQGNVIAPTSDDIAALNNDAVWMHNSYVKTYSMQCINQVNTYGDTHYFAKQKTTVIPFQGNCATEKL